MLLSNSVIWKSTFIATTAALIIAFALPTGNANGPESSTFAGRSLLVGSRTPKPILTIFQRACQDCHSGNTDWPWYSRIPPISGKIHEDVARGRKFMDLSKWATYTDAERSGFLLARRSRSIANPNAFRQVWDCPGPNLFFQPRRRRG